MAVTGILALTTATSFTQQRKARKERQRAGAVERRQAEVRNVRERKKALAARIRASAAAESAGQQAGVGAGSSVVQAEQASLGAQFGANVGFAQELEQLSAERTAFLESAGAHVQRARTFQEVGTAAVSGVRGHRRGKAGGATE